MICCSYFRDLSVSNLQFIFTVNKEMNKGFVQTRIYRCQICKRTRISDSDSAATESDDGAEEFEILVACQGVEACEALEQEKKGTGN